MLKFWLVLVIIVSCISLWLFGRASYDLCRYAMLNRTAIAHVEGFSIEQTGSSRFVIKAEYSYEASGAKLKGETLFLNPYYLNRPTAERALKNWEKKQWQVFYSSWRPSFSSMQRMFPFKSCIHAVLALGVLVYFFFLRRYLLRLAES